MCDARRDGPTTTTTTTTTTTATCQTCGAGLTGRGPRARYCSRACQQRAFRARHVPAPPVAADPTALRRVLARQRAVRGATVYECGGCGEQQLGVQRCAACGLFGAAVGLGGDCPHCGDLVLLSDLLPGLFS